MLQPGLWSCGVMPHCAGVCRRARKSVRFAKREEASISSKGQFDGRVTAIRGAVVDLVFEHGPPPIDDAVEIEDAEGRIVVAEIQAQLDGSFGARDRARGDDGAETRRSRRAAPAARSRFTVGEAILGRLIDVLGRVGDRGPPLPADAPRWPIHRKPPPFAVQTGATRLFSTGVKVIDLLAPLAQGGKAAMFGGAGVGKTVLVMELIHAMVETYQGHLACSPASASARAKVTRCCST